ncbi:uncharacterized protein LOC141714646 [Apium graveolens]|uniref:uncharacterized protein LOC141714646 n=1 Tax=Apium graveolens TaxID=4045 RepID=UPI003D7BC97A
MLVEGEKRGGRQQLIGLLTGFRDTITDCGLIDLGFVGEKFTWEKSRGKTDWVQERLDRAFANHSWCELFPEAELKVVPNGWDDAGGRDITKKILLCGTKLQECGGGVNKEYIEKLQLCRERLRRLRSRRDMLGVNMYNEVRWEFLQLYASQRRKTNSIERIKDDSGQWCETGEQIQGVIESYFSKLFTATSLNGQLSQRDEVSQISMQENVDLVLDVTEEEVRDAVFAMHPEKSPGIDGFNPAFYQVFWSIVKHDVVNFC